MLAESLDLLAYSRWATRRLAEVSSALAAEPYHRTLGGSYPSLHATWDHLLRAEWIWLARWRGDPAGATPDLDEAREPGALPGVWEALWREQARFTDALTDAGASRPVKILTRTGIAAELSFAQCVRHMVNHASYHRGQITHFLRQLGAEPVGTDLFLYYVHGSPRD